jgi:hypothetical protein
MPLRGACCMPVSANVREPMPPSLYVRGFASLMLAVLATSCASNFDHRGDASCAIQVPPADSGELGIHGKLMKVHPRISSMPAGFSGCQTLWVDSPGGWEMSRLLVHRGRVVKLFDSKLECKYAGGELQSATGGECPASEPEVLPSEPAGCISQDVGGPKPREVCVDDHPPP